MDKPIIVSHPRSGLNYVRYVVEYCTGLRTPGQSKLLEFGDVAFYRTHDAFSDRQGTEIWPLSADFRRCVLLLRNYRAFAHHGSGYGNAEWDVEGHVSGLYTTNLLAFSDFPGKKACIYYEDLLARPADTFPRLFDALGLTYDFTDFDFNYHSLQSLGLRKHKPGPLKDALKRMRAIRESPPKKAGRKLTSLDNKYRRVVGPELYDRYLSRYGGG